MRFFKVYSFEFVHFFKVFQVRRTPVSGLCPAHWAGGWEGVGFPDARASALRWMPGAGNWGLDENAAPTTSSAVPYWNKGPYLALSEK